VSVIPSADETHAFPSRVERDRLARAVAGLILWDHLDDDARASLAGPWAELVEASI
jgi:hypothetical protein